MSGDSEVLYESLIHENVEKGFQLKLVVNLFREVEYLHIRKYFLSFDEGYLPSKEGISMPCTLDNVYKLLDSLVEITAKAESLDSIKEHFDKITKRLEDERPESIS